MLLTMLISISTSERFGIFDSLDYNSNDGKFCKNFVHQFHTSLGVPLWLITQMERFQLLV